MRAMHLDKRTSADLDYLKAFAAFLVVLGHCLSYYTAWQPLPLFAGIAEDLIYHVHVPLFFTISGFCATGSRCARTTRKRCSVSSSRSGFSRF